MNAYTVIRPARPRRRRRAAEWLYRHLNGVFLGLGAACIAAALNLGAGFTLGWWWFLFWFGAGIIVGTVRS